MWQSLLLPPAGSFPDAQLPSKRIIGPKNYEFLTSKREEFQEYLQVAAWQEPAVRRSLKSFESRRLVTDDGSDNSLSSVNICTPTEVRADHVKCTEKCEEGDKKK